MPTAAKNKPYFSDHSAENPQAALLAAQRAIDTQHTQLTAQQAQLATQQAKLEQQKSYIAQLEEFIRSLRHKQFGASSEAQPLLQTSLFDESDAEPALESSQESAVIDAESDDAATIAVAAHQRQINKAGRIPAHLPREVIEHDLPDEAKVCPHDGTPLTCIGADTSEQLDIIPAQIKVLQHVRKKYACSCCQQYIVTAPKPAQPIEKSMAAPGLLAHVATQKYCDGLPLYRQTEGFNRIGVELDRTTLANWMVGCGHLLQPLLNLIQETLFTRAVLHVDETRVQVLNEPGRSAQSQSYMWVVRATGTTPAVLYHYAPSRSGEVPKLLLSDYRGALMVDGYEGYNGLCSINGLTRLGCWAHVRRKFVEAQQAQPKGKTGKADQALAYIQQLYRIEQLSKDRSAEERHGLRQEQARPIIDKLRQWLEKTGPHTPPQSLLGKALYYLQQQWPHLIHYVNNGQYPIDNNAAENAIRPFVIGRKNWLFSASQKGAKASANLYSVIETAKANGLEPYAYLRKVFTELPKAKTLEEVEALLPWRA